MNRRAHISFLFAAAALFIASCATPQIHIYDGGTGQPAMNYEINIRTPNPDEKFSAIFYVVRSEAKSKYSFVPEYLDIFKENSHQIDKQLTAGLSMSLRLINPKSLPYSVVYTVSYQKEGEKKVKMTDDTIYTGNDYDKSWVIDCPLAPGEYQMKVTIFRNQNVMFMFGDFHYVVK